MSNITLGILAIFVLFWFYCLYSVLSNKFKNEKEKIFWIIGLVFAPPLSFFYFYLKKDLLDN